MFRERFRLINPEWFREPPSKLESTLRTPYLIKHSINLFFSRIGPKWFLFGVILWFLSNNAFFSIAIGFLLFLSSELLTLKNYFDNYAVPKHLDNVKFIKNLACKLNELTKEQLIKAIKNSLNKATWGLVNIGYVGLSSWGWEIIFKTFYPLLVKSDVSYQNFLIGFENKSTESDQALWEVAQEESRIRQEKLLNQFLLNYGGKVDDVEFSKPTLREKPEVIKKLLEVYKNTSSPKSIVKKQKEKRIQFTKEIYKKTRIPKFLFNKFLKIVQENVSLRENRRHYHFLTDYEIRMMLLALAKMIKISEKEMFNKSWKEIIKIK